MGQKSGGLVALKFADRVDRNQDKEADYILQIQTHRGLG